MISGVYADVMIRWLLGIPAQERMQRTSSMPIMKVKPGDWAAAASAFFELWMNPTKPGLARETRIDLDGHITMALRRTLGPQSVPIDDRKLRTIHKTAPTGVRLPLTRAELMHSLIAASLLYNALRLAVHASDKASLENGLRLYAFGFKGQGLPCSRATAMKAWNRYKSISPYLAALFIDLRRFNLMRRLVGLTVSKKAAQTWEDVFPITDDNIARMIANPKKRGASFEKLYREIFPEFFATAERLRLLAEKHYAPGRKARSQPLLDPKTTWKLPPGFEFPPVRVHFKRLSTAEKAALSSR